MRLLLCLLPAFVALCACNVAVSDHPMFSPEDRLSIPLKDGLWVADDPDCPFDVKTPKTQWPKCAFWTTVSDKKFVDFAGDKEEERPVGTLIAKGRPPIVQVEVFIKGDRSFLFFAIEPQASDPSGSTTAMDIWAVACGTQRSSGSSSQVDPYPGFNKECQPLTTKALRAAAVASRPKVEKVGRINWVRAETP